MSHFTVLNIVSSEQISEKEEALRNNPSLDLFEMFSDADSYEDEDLFLRGLAIKKAIDSNLAPYQENNMGDCPEEYLEFNDCTEEVIEKTQEKVDTDTFEDAEEGMTYGEFYRQKYEDDPESYEERFLDRGFDKEELDDLTDVDIVAVLYYCYTRKKSYEQFSDLYYGDEEKKYGYVHNPNSKWDWYQIGGRWPGQLPYKEKQDAFTGQLSWMSSPPEEENVCSVCKVSNLDMERFEGRTQNKIDNFWERYQKFMDSGGSEEIAVHFDLIKMGIEWTNEERCQEVSKNNQKIKESRKTLEEIEYSEGDDLDQYVDQFGSQESLEEVIEDSKGEILDRPDKEWSRTLTKEDLEGEFRRHFEFSTYAAVDKNGWYAQGEMGWFGMSTEDSEARENWDRGFMDRFIRSQDSDAFVAVIDCHV